MLNLAQSFVVTMGMLSGCLLCAYEISIGERGVDAFVIFITYLAQLYQPVRLFSVRLLSIFIFWEEGEGEQGRSY